MTSCEPAMKPPQEASDFENVPIRRSTSVLDAEQLAGARRRGRRARRRRGPRRPSAARRSARQSSTISRQRRRRRPPSRRRRRRRPARRRRRRRRARASSRACRAGCGGTGAASRARAGSRRGSRRGRRSRRSPCRRAPRIVPSVPTLAWWPVVKTIASSVPIHSASSRLELEVQVDRAVEQARAGQAGAVALERVAGALHDALVGGQPEVVVGAEHDPLGALHLDDRAGRALEHAEVGQQVGLAGGAQLLGALVAADLREDVDGGAACSVGSARRVDPVDVRPSPRGATCARSSSCRTGCTLPPASGSRRCGSSAGCSSIRALQRVLQARRARSCSSPAATGGSSGRISAQVDDAFNALPRQPLGHVRLPRVRGRPGGRCRALLEAAEALAARAAAATTWSARWTSR